MSSQSSQASRAIENLGPAEFQRKVSELVRYMLCQDKKKLPIKRPDINRNVLKEHVRCFQPIFEKAKEFLLNIFGIDVVESEVGKTKSYFLVNDLDTRNEDVIPWSKEVKHSGLLMIIISLIYMSDGVVSDDILKRTLKQLGIRKDVNHKEFGDIEKTIQEFVKQTFMGLIFSSGRCNTRRLFARKANSSDRGSFSL
ncbi:non-structural maintenance of chromosomes element 3 homolog isoform X2 [Rhopilema esculentum]|uniref:non-structural maintenance of chromosomes element 3 homolog isoform X2 n=1 Tax=Rhopilema esculentum TaxID=499914 RepID=UPI0031E19251